MRRSIMRWTVVSLLFAGGAAVAVVAPNLPQAMAEPPVTPQADKPTPATPAAVATIKVAPQPSARICKALKEPTTIEFVDAPLQDVVDYLKDLHDIEIQIDTKVLCDATVAPDSPVTCQLKGVSLGAALDLMLKRLDLDYLVAGEVLLITAAHPDQPRLTVRLYDCSWAKPDQFADLSAVIELLNSGRKVDAAVAPEPAGDDDHAPTASAFRVVPYGSWLAVRASDIEHETVRRLLAELRAVTDAKAAATTATDKESKSAKPAGAKP